MKNIYAHIEKGLRALLAAVLGVTLCLPALPGVALAADDAPPVGSFAGIAPARFEDAPAVGTTIDLGYGMITGLECVGETAATGHIYFTMDFDDTYDIFGGSVTMSGLACMELHKYAPGGWIDPETNVQPWPVRWVGDAVPNDCHFKASAKVLFVNYEDCSITYSITAWPVLWYNLDTVRNNYQRMEAIVTVPYTPTGVIQLSKVSSSPECTAGNPMYSLEGAVYGLYTSEDDAVADENRLFTFVTDETGATNATDRLDTGTYYVKEISASKGYRIDDEIHEVTVVGGTNTFTMFEIPFSDPPAIYKVDADLEFDPTVEFDASNNLPQGGATLAGAQFAVNYYAIDGTPSADEVAGLTPTRSWVLQTGTDGFAGIGEEFLVSGDPLYIDELGAATIPLGVVSITEIKAPEGYLMPENPPTYMVRITPEGPDYYDTGYSAVFVTDEVIKGQISVAKSLLAPGGTYLDRAALEGIEVQVILVSGSTCTLVETLTMDAEGKAISSFLPYGSYELIEVAETLPQGIQPWSWTTYLSDDSLPIAHIDITEADTYEAFFTDFATTTITVTKTDADTHETLPGAKFALYKVPAEALLIDRGNVTLNPEASWEWQLVSELTTGTAGSVGFNELPFGIYAVMETKAPAGYLTETQMANTDEPVLHVFTMDAAHGSVAFSVEDKKVEISVEVHEYTIAETTAAFDGSPYGFKPNTGKEEIIYHIGTCNRSTVDTSTYTLTNSLAELNEMGCRATRFWTGTAAGDHDGLADFYIKTTMSTGWIHVATVDLAKPTQIDVASMGLLEGDYVTDWKVEFGEVDATFHSGVDYGDGFNWCFAVVCTEALTPADGTLRNAVTVRTELVVDADTTIYDEDRDAVETGVVAAAFGIGPGGGVISGSLVLDLPHTADGATRALTAAATVMVAAAVGAWVAFRKKRGARKTDKRVALALLATLMTGQILTLNTAQGAEPEEGESTPQTITREIVWPADEPAPAVPDELTIEGETWRLQGLGMAAPAPGEVTVQTYYALEEGVAATEEQLVTCAPESREVTEGEFSGTVFRTLFEYEGEYEYAPQIRETTRVYGPFATNDFAGVPRELTTAVRDDEGQHTMTWTWIDAKWEEAAPNEAGMPTGFNCVVTYRGQTTLAHFTGIRWRAVYEGELTAPPKFMTMTATYERVEPPMPAPAEPWRLPSGVVAGSAAVAALAFGFFMFFRSRNVTICRLSDQRVLAKTHAKRTRDGGLLIKLPAVVAPEDGLVLLLRPNLCDGSPCQLTQAGVVLAEFSAQARFELAAKALAAETVAIVDPVDGEPDATTVA